MGLTLSQIQLPMALGKRRRDYPGDRFVSTGAIRPSSNALYRAWNKRRVRKGFDDYVEAVGAPFYAEKLGRLGLPPRVYFRILMIGFLEGLGSARARAWRCHDFLALRAFWH